MIKSGLQRVSRIRGRSAAVNQGIPTRIWRSRWKAWASTRPTRAHRWTRCTVGRLVREARPIGRVVDEVVSGTKLDRINGVGSVYRLMDHHRALLDQTRFKESTGATAQPMATVRRTTRDTGSRSYRTAPLLAKAVMKDTIIGDVHAQMFHDLKGWPLDPAIGMQHSHGRGYSDLWRHLPRIVLHMGDQLYAPNGVSFRRRNDGPTPATTLDFSLGTGGAPSAGTALPGGVTADSGLPSKQPSAYPAVPAEATVHRLTLAPGDELAVRDLAGLEQVYVESGALNLVYARPESPESPERAVTIWAGSGTETFGPTPDRAVLANRGAEPLVILAASVVPAGAREPAPQEPWSDGWGTGDHKPALQT